MNADERAEARRLVDAATSGPWVYNPYQTCINVRNGPLLFKLKSAVASDAALVTASRTLIPKLLDALEAAERERGECRDLVVIEHTERTKAERERDTARAQVKTLAEALGEWLAAEEAFIEHMGNATTSTWHPGYGDEHWERYQNAVVSARAALKAAGVES